MKKLLVLFIIQLLATNTFSQRNELGFHLGGAYYIGDLNPSTHFLGIRPGGGLTYRRNFTDNLALKLTGTYMNLQADNNKTGFNSYGNISFKSQLIEAAGCLEVDFFPFFMGGKEYYATPYIYGGLGGYYHMPELQIDDAIKLNIPYSNYGNHKPLGLSIPFGVGVKAKITDKICLSFEWGMRRVFTDELEEVNSIYIEPENQGTTPQQGYSTNTNSQIGTDEDQDWYSFSGVHITFKIKNKTKECKIYDSVK